MNRKVFDISNGFNVCVTEDDDWGGTYRVDFIYNFDCEHLINEFLNQFSKHDYICLKEGKIYLFNRDPSDQLIFLKLLI